MTNSIRTILKPFLMISYMFGLKIANLSLCNLKLWFNILYVLLIWLIHYFILTCSLIYSLHISYPIEFHICYWLETFINLLTITFGVYYDKKFQNCLKKLDIVDDTLLKLRTVTDYDKLHKKSLCLILGWFIITISLNSITTLYAKVKYDCDILTAMIIVFTQNYFFHINIIADLTTTTILRYIGLKFDQINKHFRYMMTNDDYEMKQVWKNLMIHSHQCRFSKTMYSKHMIWIVIHLHLELRKISCEIDSIFGTQMSFKMACYFSWLVLDLRSFFYAFDDHKKFNEILYAAMHLLWFFHNVSKFLLINYVCETVSTKANAIGDLINRLYSTCDMEVREIISQFLLRMTYVPLRFWGIGFFQFGFKFLHRFIMSVATVLVIVIQARENK